MSLLLDALKRAEQEKLARHGQDAPPGPEPAETPAAAPRRKLELELHETAPAPAAPAAAAGESAAAKREREGAKTVFAAKQPDTAAAPAKAAGSRKALIAVIVGAVVLAAAGGGYVWYEINKKPAQVARGPLPSAPPKPVVPAKAEGAVVPPVALPTPETAAATPEKAKPEPKAAEKLVMNLLSESPSARPAPPLKLSRTIEAPRVSPQVSAGYEALKRGDPATARRHYEAAVAADATSLDAQLGLATAAARMGERDLARRHYRRALELDPKNPSAVAGLAALADFTRPDGLEAQLRADLASHPRSAALHFTLGNLYASQSRWTEAQASYFEAYRFDPDNADLAYNLAVSLDHLGQARLAAEFYQRALAASQTQAAQFDKGQVSRRVAELRP